MSISSRRNSVLKSSISIKSIADTVVKFRESLSSARTNAQDAQQQLRETNQFKRTLIRKDNIFFRRRQENIRRKDREDELEASSVQGTSKRQGSMLAKSTRGFLGRILDFLGILLLGWAATNLPKILMGINKLINNIRRVGGILGSFVNGVKDVVVGIGSMVGETLGKLMNFDFLDNKSKLDKELEGTQGNIQKSQTELVQSANLFSDPENFGLEDPPGFEMDNKQEKESKQTSNESDAGADPISVDGQEQQKAEIEGIVNDIGTTIEKKGEEDTPIEGEAADIEGVETDTGGVEPQSGGAKSAPATASSSIEDPREVLKKKQNESIKRNQRNKNRRDRSKSQFLGTPSSVANINESVTPTESTSLDPVEEYNADFEGGQGGSRKVNFSSLVTPTKKEVDVKTSRKPTRTVMIMEKPVNMSSPSVSMPSGGGGNELISSAVQDEKMLMKMQSTSSLKYT
mgnify:CR=1 FL=1